MPGYIRRRDVPILGEVQKELNRARMPEEMKNRRAHYRIVYPIRERPRLVYGSAISEVIECSERGIRFRTAGALREPGTRLNGRVSMRHGKEVRISGTIVWSDDQTTAVHLDRTPIPFLAMMREQLYLRQAAYEMR